MNPLPPATLLVPLEPFRFILKINKDIRNSRYTGDKFTDSTFDTSKFSTGINDTSGHTFHWILTLSVIAAANLPLESTTLMINLPRCQQRLQ